MFEAKCNKCEGDGWYSDSGHGCDGTEMSCYHNCPVQVQVQCEVCCGVGTLEIGDDIKL